MKQTPQFLAKILVVMIVVGAPLIWLNSVEREKAREKTLLERERLCHQQVNVVYARREIYKGTKLTADMLEIKQVEAKNTFGSAVTDIRFALGRVLRHALHKDDVVETEYHLGLQKLNPSQEVRDH